MMAVSGGGGAGRSFDSSTPQRSTSTAPPVEWCRRTCDEVVPGQPCTLATLAKRAGVPARTIVEQNGATWSVPAVNAWVISVGGTWAPLAKGAQPMPGSPPGKGWALLSPTSKVLLPVCDSSSSTSAAAKGGAALAVFTALAAIGGAIVYRRRRKKA
jgi:hypothetical protein